MSVPVHGSHCCPTMTSPSLRTPTVSSMLLHLLCCDPSSFATDFYEFKLFTRKGIHPFKCHAKTNKDAVIKRFNSSEFLTLKHNSSGTDPALQWLNAHVCLGISIKEKTYYLLIHAVEVIHS